MTDNMSSMDQDAAERLAIAAFGFIAGDPNRLVRFLDFSGYQPDAIRDAASSPDFLAGILDFLLSDESLLLVFASHSELDPRLVHGAMRTLARSDDSNGVS